MLLTQAELDYRLEVLERHNRRLARLRARKPTPLGAYSIARALKNIERLDRVAVDALRRAQPSPGAIQALLDSENARMAQAVEDLSRAASMVGQTAVHRLRGFSM